MLRNTVSTGLTSAPRPSRELSSMALELRLWSLLVRRRHHNIPNELRAHCLQFVQIFLMNGTDYFTGRLILCLYGFKSCFSCSKKTLFIAVCTKQCPLVVRSLRNMLPILAGEKWKKLTGFTVMYKTTMGY